MACCYNPCSSPLSLTRVSSRAAAKPQNLLLPTPSSSPLSPSPRSLSSFPPNSRRLSIVPNPNPNSLKKLLCVPQSKAPAVTQKSWEKEVLNNETPVLVEFYASWCGPCRMVDRVIDEIAVEYAGRLKCFVLNTDEDSRIAEDYEIKAVPVVLLFKNGQKCEIVAGTMPKEFYVAAIERVLKL